jgi:hypothetical protein
MQASPDETHSWMLVIGMCFLLAVAVSAIYLPAVANTESLLRAWRVVMAMLAIILVKRFADMLPRIRFVLVDPAEVG